jgi:GxxExxY protein
MTRIMGETNPNLKHRELTEKIIGVFYDVYNELGYGFLESVYEEALGLALVQAGLSVARQIPVPVHFRGVCVGDFRADMIVEDAVIVELKALKQIDSHCEKQILNYLRATECEVGLLLNFGEHPAHRRFVFDNTRKKIRVNPRSSAASGSK